MDKGVLARSNTEDKNVYMMDLFQTSKQFFPSQN